MQLKALLLCVILSSVCSAQDTFSIYSRLAPPSPSSGNGGQAGIGVDGVWMPVKNVMLDVDTSVVREAKTYVGNGWTWRGQAEGLIGHKAFWFGGGMSAGRHANSQYVKHQYQPMLSAHYRPRLEVDVYGTYLLRASGNENGVQGYRLGYRGVFPTSRRLGIFIQSEYTRFKFKTAFLEERSGNVWTVGFGFSRIAENIR